MFRRILVLAFLCICAGTLLAQDLSNIQIHGFVTQGFLYSTNNNLFTMNTSDGSAQWTDAVVSFNDSLSDKLRVGVQLHVYQLGEIGGPNLQIDWASGDYRVNDKVGFIAGKVKTVFGLFNDSQDVDAVHFWVLLPEPFYPVDNKTYLLSHYGGDFYGRMDLGKHYGKLSYQGYAGYRPLDLTGGNAKLISEHTGMAFTSGGGNMFGGDLRWETPLKGLLVGASAITSDLVGIAPTGALTGTFRTSYTTIPVFYAKFEKGKFMAAGEYKRENGVYIIHYDNFRGGGPATFPAPYDQRSWYAMSSYRISEKVQVGAYYSHQGNAHPNYLPGPPASQYSNDAVISGRYDFNSYVYAKLEGHFINGTLLGYYSDTNPNGEKNATQMLAAKIGFSF
jgi:hypothetical protein